MVGWHTPLACMARSGCNFAASRGIRACCKEYSRTARYGGAWRMSLRNDRAEWLRKINAMYRCFVRF